MQASLRSRSPFGRGDEASRAGEAEACPYIGEPFEPAAYAPSSRLFQRFMFAEMMGSLMLTLVACGSVVASGTLTYQLNFRELTIGRMTVIALANGLVRTCRCAGGIPARPHGCSFCECAPPQAYAALVFAMSKFSELPWPTRREGEPAEGHAQSDADVALEEDSALGATKLQHRKLLVGHFNPSVTLACMLSGDVSLPHAFMYWTAQFFGACMASVFLVICIPDARSTQLGSTVLMEGSTAMHGLLMETLLTFLLITVLNAVAAARTGPTVHPFVRELAPLLLGLIVFAANMVGGPVSGASLNPARSFGPAAMSDTWTNHWIYWAGPCLGATLAAMTHNLSRFITRFLSQVSA